MAIKSSREIYRVLEEAIRSATSPRSCVDLLEVDKIRAVAIAEYGKDMRVTTDKVSDALGLMWRRGYLKRFPAPPDSKTLARYAYLWDDKVSRPVAPVSFPSGKTGMMISEKDGGDPHQAQRLLGHDKISTTEGYIKQRSTEVVQPMRSNDDTERDHQRQPS